MEAIKEELLVLQASLVEGELEWADEECEAAWESVLSDASPLTAVLPLPRLRLRLASHAQLEINYRADAPPEFSLHSATLDRDDQMRLATEVERQKEELGCDDPSLPGFTIFTSLQEYLAANPVKAPSRSSQDLPRTASPPKSGPLQLKTTLIWSHHLLATSKRKDIVAWSTELTLFGISKPGYPGVIVVEGAKEQVDEFVWRIKQLQWKALQIRCEQDGAVVTPPPDVSPPEAAAWAVRHRSHLGPVLSSDLHHKICVREVEGLNEVGDIMRNAGLEDVFLTAMKLNKGTVA
ncbi:hypothetical protein JCM5296_000358 [Sporobolomyces johnsonii]